MSARAHAAAVRSTVAAQGATVYDEGKVPKGALTPYTVLTTDLGLDGGYRFNGGSSSKRWRITALVVGATGDEARWEADRVITALQGRLLTVTGFSATPCRSESSQAVTRDFDVPSLSSAAGVWTFISTPA